MDVLLANPPPKGTLSGSSREGVTLGAGSKGRFLREWPSFGFPLNHPKQSKGHGASKQDRPTSFLWLRKIRCPALSAFRRFTASSRRAKPATPRAAGGRCGTCPASASRSCARRMCRVPLAGWRVAGEGKKWFGSRASANENKLRADPATHTDTHAEGREVSPVEPWGIRV